VPNNPGMHCAWWYPVLLALGQGHCQQVFVLSSSFIDSKIYVYLLDADDPIESLMSVHMNLACGSCMDRVSFVLAILNDA
jgi:hypothetical protein